MTTERARVVALGASNLTLGLPFVVSAARARFGTQVEFFVAAGLGRSYGKQSRVLARTLPGILDCGLWSALPARPPAATRALVTDVGNDILYGASPGQILEWVETALERLRNFTRDLVLTGLPVDSIRRLTPARFAAFRTLFFPSSRSAYSPVIEASEVLDDGLAGLAQRYGARFVPLPGEWYGFDPVHIRPGRWRMALQEVIGAPAERPGVMEAIGLHALPPEREWVLGLERVHPQRGVRLAGGGSAWLY